MEIKSIENEKYLDTRTSVFQNSSYFSIRIHQDGFVHLFLTTLVVFEIVLKEWIWCSIRRCRSIFISSWFPSGLSDNGFFGFESTVTSVLCLSLLPSKGEDDLGCNVDVMGGWLRWISLSDIDLGWDRISFQYQYTVNISQYYLRRCWLERGGSCCLSLVHLLLRFLCLRVNGPEFW